MFQSKIYNYAIDVWSLGLVFAELLFLTKEAFVEGKELYDQLMSIAGVLGSEDLHTYLNKFGL